MDPLKRKSPKGVKHGFNSYCDYTCQQTGVVILARNYVTNDLVIVSIRDRTDEQIACYRALLTKSPHKIFHPAWLHFIGMTPYLGLKLTNCFSFKLLKQFGHDRTKDFVAIKKGVADFK